MECKLVRLSIRKSSRWSGHNERVTVFPSFSNNNFPHPSNDLLIDLYVGGCKMQLYSNSSSHLRLSGDLKLNSSKFWSVQPVLTDGPHHFFYFFFLWLPQLPPSAALNPGFSNKPSYVKLTSFNCSMFLSSCQFHSCNYFSSPCSGSWWYCWILSTYTLETVFWVVFKKALSVKHKLKVMRSSFYLWGVARVHFTWQPVKPWSNHSFNKKINQSKCLFTSFARALTSCLFVFFSLPTC